MRILFFHPLTGRYRRGIERNVVELSSCMAQLGHDVAILTLAYPGRALMAELDPRVRVHRAPHSRYLAHICSVPFFTWHLLRYRYDAIIIFFGGFGVGPSLRATRLVEKARGNGNVPVFIYLGYPASLAPHRYDELERWGLPTLAQGIWAHGEHVAAEAERRFGLPVTPLPTGVRIDLFQPDTMARQVVRAELGLGDDAPLVLTVAACEERKGMQHVIAAWSRVLEELPDARYLIVGDGPYAVRLQDMIDRLRLDATVTLLPALEHVQRYYATADVFCLLARGEAGPNAIYEALACEVPVVALREPHLEAHLCPDVAEFLPSLEPEAVAASLVTLLDDAERRRRMGSAGRTLVEERYTFAALARRICGLIGGEGADDGAVEQAEMAI